MPPNLKLYPRSEKFHSRTGLREFLVSVRKERRVCEALQDCERLDFNAYCLLLNARIL